MDSSTLLISLHAQAEVVDSGSNNAASKRIPKKSNHILRNIVGINPASPLNPYVLIRHPDTKKTGLNIG